MTAVIGRRASLLALEEEMQTIHTGIIIDDTIRLDGPIDLPNGQSVQVVLIPQSPILVQNEYVERVNRCAGALADLPQSEFDDLDEITASRQQAVPRDME